MNLQLKMMLPSGDINKDNQNQNLLRAMNPPVVLLEAIAAEYRREHMDPKATFPPDTVEAIRASGIALINWMRDDKDWLYDQIGLIKEVPSIWRGYFFQEDNGDALELNRDAMEIFKFSEQVIKEPRLPKAAVVSVHDFLREQDAQPYPEGKIIGASFRIFEEWLTSKLGIEWVKDTFNDVYMTDNAPGKIFISYKSDGNEVSLDSRKVFHEDIPRSDMLQCESCGAWLPCIDVIPGEYLDSPEDVSLCESCGSMSGCMDGDLCFNGRCDGFECPHNGFTEEEERDPWLTDGFA